MQRCHQRRMHQPSLPHRGAVATVDIRHLLCGIAGAHRELLVQDSEAFGDHFSIYAASGVKPARQDRFHFPRHAGRLDATPSLIC
ncbi:MAG: hypothetical protein EBY30_15420 [Rhodospirillales bacterium]|nr:hypothetical protein [Rhodospirillales bacterium]